MELNIWARSPTDVHSELNNFRLFFKGVFVFVFDYFYVSVILLLSPVFNWKVNYKLNVLF